MSDVIRLASENYVNQEIPTKVSELENDNGYRTESDIFIATYGQTTYEEIKEAYEANKEVILIILNANDTDGKTIIARLVRANKAGNDYSFNFEGNENGISHYAAIDPSKGWVYWNIDYRKEWNERINISNSNINKLLPLLTSSLNSFRGGFRNTAGTLDIKAPGIYIITGGGTGNKTMTITQNGTEVYKSPDCNGWFVLSSDDGVVTPFGIKSGLGTLGMFEIPGTYQGWIKGETTPTHTTKITYPAMCVIWYLGNAKNDAGTWN